MTRGITMLVQFGYITEAVSTISSRKGFARSPPNTMLNTLRITADRRDNSIIRTVSTVRSI